MIDLSKYEKVYEWNSFYGIVFKRWFLSGPVVYLIKIGDGIYINCADKLRSVYEVHLSLLRKGKHPNIKMSDCFSKHQNFEVYILESVNVFTHPHVVAQNYIAKYNPSLNEADSEYGIDQSAWDRDERREMIGLRISQWVLNGIHEICDSHGLTREDVINTAVVYFLDATTYRDRWELTRTGITLMNKGNMHTNR